MLNVGSRFVVEVSGALTPFFLPVKAETYERLTERSWLSPTDHYSLFISLSVSDKGRSLAIFIIKIKHNEKCCALCKNKGGSERKKIQKQNETSATRAYFRHLLDKIVTGARNH
jgi:hypothetical protein